MSRCGFKSSILSSLSSSSSTLSSLSSSSSPKRLHYGYVAIFIALLINLSHGATVNQVSIEDFIDLDEESPSNNININNNNNNPNNKNSHNPINHVINNKPLVSLSTNEVIEAETLAQNDNNDVSIRIIKNNNNNNNNNNDRANNNHNNKNNDYKNEDILLQKGTGSILSVDNDVIVDDEDLLASGSGSGSGDDLLLEIEGDGKDGGEGLVLTETGRGRGRKNNGVDILLKGKDKLKEGTDEKDDDDNGDNELSLDDFLSDENIKDIILGKRSGNENDEGHRDQQNNNMVIDRNDNKNNNNKTKEEEEKEEEEEEVLLSTQQLSWSELNEYVDDEINKNNDNDGREKDEDFQWNETTDELDSDIIDDDDDEDDDDEEEEEEEEVERVYDEFYENEFLMNDEDNRKDIDEDSVYDLVNVQSDGPEKDKHWSKWRRVGLTFKVRIEQCGKVKGQGDESKGSGTSGGQCENGGSAPRVQVKSCPKSKECGEVHETRTDLSASCDSFCQRRNESTPRPFSLSPNPSPTPAPAPTTPPTPQGCQYSLYDKKRRKYMFVIWDLSQVLTQSKVKRWCKKDNDQYLIMSTPTEVCRNYLHQLCQASQKCKSNKPPRERGDFAEGCWRGLVFGDMLPIGMSNKQTIIYFICQRYSSDSEMGRVFGYKDTHFGTLYDSKLRAPVLSLYKMVQVGDETWPHSDYFIEHGLIEQKRDVMWLFSRHRKGIVTLHDLERCYRDQTCDLGRFQVLPQDFSREAGNTAYAPVPLVWPEWMTPDPETRTATLTLTNMVPLHSSLHEEWTDAIKKVRSYAVEECGIPYVSDPTLSQLGQLSSHRSNKSALYLASGAIPSKDPVIKTGKDVPVPSHLWVAGCCVRKMVRGADKIHNDVLIDSDEDTPSTETKISSFTFYLKNEPDNRVTVGSIFGLEMLLQDFYKVKDGEPNVSLFPGQERSCSDLRNDASAWFQETTNN